MPVFVRYLVLSCLTCLAMLSLPSLILLLAIVWGVLLILAGLQIGKWQLLALFTLNILIIWLLAGSSPVVVYAFYTGLPAFTMGVFAGRNRGYYDLLKAGLGTAVIAGALVMGLFYLNGQTLNQIEPQLNSYVQQSLKQYQDSGALQLYEQKGVDRQEIEASFNRIAHTLVQHLPAIYFIQAAILIALTLYFAAQMARRRGIFKLQKRPFSQEVMPWQLAWLVIAGLALWLLGSADSVMRLTGSNLLVALAPIAAYFGLSIVFYGLNRMGPGRKAWSKALVIMLLFLLTKPILAFLALLGLFDSLLDYRKLRTDKEVSL